MRRRGREALPREARITKRDDFERAKRSGVWYRGKHLDLIVADGDAERPRIGLIIPLYGHSVVMRNTLKRRIREILRREVLPAVDGRIDIVVRARKQAYRAGYSTLKNELESLAQRAREQGGRRER